MDISPFGNYRIVQKKRSPNSELAATVEQVLDSVGRTKQYDFPYWCAIIKKAKVSYTEMQGILKNVQSADAKYNKGALLTSILKKRWTKEPINK